MILTGWKEIAAYLNCSVRTVQRWQEDGLPIRRPSKGPRSHIVADTQDIDRWLTTSSLRRMGGNVLVMQNIERACRLSAEVQRSCQNLTANIALLQKELDALRTRKRSLTG